MIRGLLSVPGFLCPAITVHDQTDGWHMETSGVVRVSVPKLDCDKLFTFEIDHISVERLGDDEAVCNLPWVSRVPEVCERLWRCLLLHDLHNARRRKRTGFWKALLNSGDAEEMIAVTMCDIDRGEVLAALCNPVHKGNRLFKCEKCVDKNRIALAGDQRRR